MKGVVDSMIIIKDDVMGIAEKILLLIEKDGYDIEEMPPEELGELVDEYLARFYDCINEDEEVFEQLLEDEEDDFKRFYKDFTWNVRNKDIHMNKYLN